ncbi:sulfurtransferase [Humitalea sp. 24SJ18S-53]|uniref:sulfurtransferase n=1 Tax=Humitalea sp. 24SJ18S-53 TaxID=3422307 RepID=UPI003D67500F
MRKVLISAKDLATWLTQDDAPVVLAVRGGPVAPATPRIPGAVDVELPRDLASPQSGFSGSRPLPAIAALQAAARAWGITQNRAVVLYDHDRCLQAGRGWWVLTWAGIADVRMLDGGFAAWTGPTATEAPSPAPGDVTLSAGHLPVLDADAAAAMARAAILLDTRIRPNYIGGVTAPGQPGRGHIPGSISAPVIDTLTEAGTVTDPATLRHLYGALGVDGRGQVGVSCGAGVSAALTVALLASIGIEAAMFPGSWSAWSADPARPVAIGGLPG